MLVLEARQVEDRLTYLLLCFELLQNMDRGTGGHEMSHASHLAILAMQTSTSRIWLGLKGRTRHLRARQFTLALSLSPSVVFKSALSQAALRVALDLSSVSVRYGGIVSAGKE